MKKIFINLKLSILLSILLALSISVKSYSSVIFPFDKLINEIQINIHNFSTPKELIDRELVSKNFMSSDYQNVLWKSQFHRVLPKNKFIEIYKRFEVRGVDENLSWKQRYVKYYPVILVEMDLLVIPESENKEVGALKMSKYPLIQKIYKLVMGKNPSTFKGDYRPLENMELEDLKEFISKLNDLVGKKNFYRIPNEYEWKHAMYVDAVKPGNEKLSYDNKNDRDKFYKYPHGSDEIEGLDEFGYIKKIYTDGTCDVRKIKKTNKYGIPGITGNVWEVVKRGDEYVSRGGGWCSNDLGLRCFDWGRFYRNDVHDGARLCRNI